MIKDRVLVLMFLLGIFLVMFGAFEVGRTNQCVVTERFDTPCSISENYAQVFFLMSPFALSYYDDPYFVARAHIIPVSHYTFIRVLKSYGYGIYEWKGKISNTDHGGQLFGFEHHAGWAGEGIADFHILDGTLNCRTSWNGSFTVNDKGAWSYGTTEVTFKIDWNVDRVLFYINGDLIDVISTNVPQDDMGFFVEVYALTGCSIEPMACVREKSFKVLQR